MEHWNKAVAFMVRTAQSAQELIRDQDLRSKGIQTVITGAQSRLQGIQNGIAQRAGRLGERLQDNRRQLQALLQTLEDRLNASQRAWQLQARRRDRVDVQFGRQVIADAPQEVRARLWYVLLENPNLAAPLKCENPGPIPNRLSDDGVESEDLGDLDRGPSRTRGSLGDPGVAAITGAGGSGSSGGGGGDRGGGGRLAAAAAALRFGRGSTNSFTSPSATSVGGASRRDRDRSGGFQGGPHDSGSGPTQQQQQGQQAGLGSPAVSNTAGAAQMIRMSRAGTSSAQPATTSAFDYGRSNSGGDGGGGGDSDGWELVTDVPGGGSAASAAAMLAAAHPEAIRIIMERLEALGVHPLTGGCSHLTGNYNVLAAWTASDAFLSFNHDPPPPPPPPPAPSEGPEPLDESGSDPVLVAQQAVLEAMLQVPWETGVGLPADVAPDSRFALLNEMTAGQEEVDDSILRDIHRTFPEHPYFGMEQGQRSLFRVLKAYSLHDLEVAYCQGMAFMAGVLLMYVPEETAFRLFCRLMETEGPNLRRLYLPGLEPLKAELATFELLLTWRLPELGTHLTEFGLPPVLYVSQWLMTLFATPFPPAFCARVIDVLLQDGHDRLLLRCSFAVIEALEAELLARHDFEALITYLKMEPVSWGLTRQRAIMDRALNSPITDAEIEVARDTVANRHYLATAAAAAAAAGAGTSSSAAGAAGVEGARVAEGAGSAATTGVSAGLTDLLGPSVPGTVAAAAGAASAIEQRQLSMEHAVEAALTVAAAAAISAEERGSAGPSGMTVDGDAAAAGGAAASPRCRTAGGDMISFDPYDGGSRPHGHTSGQGVGTEVEGGGCSSSASGRRSYGPGSGAAGGGAGAAYGMSSSLMDELGLQDRRPRKASDLEYGEYGEMLLDAGLLLPELGTAGTTAAGDGSGGMPGGLGAAVLPVGGGGGALDVDGFGPFVRSGPPVEGMAGLSLGGPQQQHHQHQQRQAGDLLLD